MTFPIQKGRKKIYSRYAEITDENIVDVLTNALQTFQENFVSIEYLYNYYKGIQPILQRVKEIRPEINNQIVENRANEIVTFKSGYFLGEPLIYVNRSEDNLTEQISLFNDYCYLEDKENKDYELAQWFYICGTANRLVLPAPEGFTESPFKVYTLDPRSSFVVYHNGVDEHRLMGVKFITNVENQIVYSVWTKNKYYEIINGEIVKKEDLILPDVPMIEYPANSARLGAFEIVLPLLDAINQTQSDRVNGVESFVQSLLVLKGIDLDDNQWNKLQNLGCLLIPTEGSADYITQELNQTQTQVLIDDMYTAVLTICGMPNRNGGTSTSDTGSAVILRDGWSDAEARAKDTEKWFTPSEKEFIKIALDIMNTLTETDLQRQAIDIKYTRRNYENIQSKATVLTSMLATDKIHPRLAFIHSGMFSDPELAYKQSEEYYEATQKQMLQELDDIEKEENAKVEVENKVVNDEDNQG